MKSSIYENYYNIIKKDNLNEFLLFIKDYPNLLLLKNFSQDNLIPYALKSKSIKILDYLYNFHYDLFFEKNSRNVTMIESALFSASKNFDFIILYAFSHDKIVSKFFKDNIGYNFLYNSINYLDSNNLNLIISNIIKFNPPKANKEESNNIINKLISLPFPFDINLFNYLSFNDDSFSNIYSSANDYILSHLKLDFKFSNSDKNTTSHLLSKNINIKDISFYFNQYQLPIDLKNIFQESPLLSSCFSGVPFNFLSLLPLYKEMDISLEIVNAFSKYGKNPDFILNTFKTLSDLNITYIKSSEEQVAKILSYVFYYLPYKDIIKSPLIMSLLKSVKNVFYVNELYTSAIYGKKDMANKIQLLIPLGFLSIEKSDKHYFNQFLFSFFPTIKTKNSFFNLSKQSFCFVSLLKTLPYNQINHILSKTNILHSFSIFDRLALNVIISFKKNPILEKYLLKINKSIIFNKYDNYNIYLNNLISQSENNDLNNLKFLILSEDNIKNFIPNIYLLSPSELKEFIFSLPIENQQLIINYLFNDFLCNKSNKLIDNFFSNLDVKKTIPFLNSLLSIDNISNIDYLNSIFLKSNTNYNLAPFIERALNSNNKNIHSWIILNKEKTLSDFKKIDVSPNNFIWDILLKNEYFSDIYLKNQLNHFCDFSIKHFKFAIEQTSLTEQDFLSEIIKSFNKGTNIHNDLLDNILNIINKNYLFFIEKSIFDKKFDFLEYFFSINPQNFLDISFDVYKKLINSDILSYMLSFDFKKGDTLQLNKYLEYTIDFLNSSNSNKNEYYILISNILHSANEISPDLSSNLLKLLINNFDKNFTNTVIIYNNMIFNINDIVINIYNNILKTDKLNISKSQVDFISKNYPQLKPIVLKKYLSINLEQNNKNISKIKL